MAIGANNPGLFTVPGTQNAWSSVGAVLGADSFADVTYTATTALVTAMGGAATAAQYGIVVGGSGSSSSIGPDDFGFDLSVLNSGAIGLLVGLDPTTKLPTTAWRSGVFLLRVGHRGHPDTGHRLPSRNRGPDRIWPRSSSRQVIVRSSCCHGASLFHTKPRRNIDFPLNPPEVSFKL